MKEVVKEWGVEVYSDRVGERDSYRVWKIIFGLDKARFFFVFNGEELVSYGGELPDRFYIKHFGEEFKGKVVEGEKFSVKKRGSEWEIEGVKNCGLRLNYIPLGSRLMPLIYIGTFCVILPEFGKVYKGRSIWVECRHGVLLVEEYMRRRKSGSDVMFRVYTLTPNGEYVVYEGDASKFHHYYSPKFFKVGDVMIVEFNKVDEKLKECFYKLPEFSYLFVRFFYEREPSKKFAEISFDLENWAQVEARNMVFKQEPELQLEYRISSSDLDQALLKCFDMTLDVRAPELYMAFRRKLPEALKELSSYISEICYKLNKRNEKDTILNL